MESKTRGLKYAPSFYDIFFLSFIFALLNQVINYYGKSV